MPPQIATLPGYSRRTVQNRIYAGYDYAAQTWHKVCLDPEKIKSICRAAFVERAFI